MKFLIQKQGSMNSACGHSSLMGY